MTSIETGKYLCNLVKLEEKPPAVLTVEQLKAEIAGKIQGLIPHSPISEVIKVFEDNFKHIMDHPHDYGFESLSYEINDMVFDVYIKPKEPPKDISVLVTLGSQHIFETSFREANET